jgi:hypothetical protein
MIPLLKLDMEMVSTMHKLTTTDDKCECYHEEPTTQPGGHDDANCKAEKETCDKHGWGCDMTTCQCTAPDWSVCKDWAKSKACYDKGYELGMSLGT